VTLAMPSSDRGENMAPHCGFRSVSNWASEGDPSDMYQFRVAALYQTFYSCGRLAPRNRRDLWTALTG